MAEWVRQQAEREAEKEQKRLERLQRKLAEPRPCSANPAYQRQCHEMAERLEDSVLKGMQAASGKALSAGSGESRKRPSASRTDGGASAGKRRCFWLGMEGLETAESSSSETSDDDGEAAPSTSGTSSRAPTSSGGGAEPAADSAGSSPRTGVQGADSRPPEPPQAPGTRSGCASSADPEPGRTSTGGCVQATMAVETEKSQEERGAGGEEPAEEGATGAGLTEETEAQDVTDGDTAAQAAPGEGGGSVPVTKPEDGPSGNTDAAVETLDLLAFSSVEEMEALGLDGLKTALTARGLKCGGTLRERAARLFSVRGLAPGQLAPALLARPPRGRRK